MAVSADFNKKVFVRLFFGVVVIFAMLFVPAGSLFFWQAWIFCAVLFVPLAFVIGYLMKHDQELLERRMRTKEKEQAQKAIVMVYSFAFFVGFLVPGLDFRFGWSSVPSLVVVLSNIIVLFGYLLCCLTFKENSFASRIVEVEKGQKVVSSGPYAVVRHPLYLGCTFMFLFLPLALGSYWALIFFAPAPFILVLRLLNEEEVLKRELEGYKEYCNKTRFRLVPFVW